jgi:WD40 repeat protein
MGPGEPVAFEGHSGRARSVVAAPQGVLSAYDGRVLTWDPERPTDYVELGRHDGWVHSALLTAQGRVVSAGYDGRVLVWDPDQPEHAIKLGHPEDWAPEVAVTPEGQIVTAGEDGRVRLWDPEQPEKLVELGIHDGGVVTAAVTMRGFVVTGGDGRVLVWDPKRPGHHIVQIRTPVAALTATSPDVSLYGLALAGAGLSLWTI